MADAEVAAGAGARRRWLMVGISLAVGIALYFWVGMVWLVAMMELFPQIQDYKYAEKSRIWRVVAALGIVVLVAVMEVIVRCTMRPATRHPVLDRALCAGIMLVPGFVRFAVDLPTYIAWAQ